MAINQGRFIIGGSAKSYKLNEWVMILWASESGFPG